MTKLTAAFRNFANAPKKRSDGITTTIRSHTGGAPKSILWPNKVTDVLHQYIPVKD